MQKSGTMTRHRFLTSGLSCRCCTKERTLPASFLPEMLARLEMEARLDLEGGREGEDEQEEAGGRQIREASGEEEEQLKEAIQHD